LRGLRQRRVLPQYGEVGRTQLRRWIDAEHIGEQAPALLVNCERARMPAGHQGAGGHHVAAVQASSTSTAVDLPAADVHRPASVVVYLERSR
jgi:hypothetical protein